MKEHIALSVALVPIRLTGERWFHISEGHPEMAGLFFDILETVNNPDFVVKGNTGELIAAKKMKDGKHLIAVYRETTKNDGFIITSFLTKRAASLKKRQIVWEIQK